MARNKQHSTTTIRVVCAIIFLTFVFSYVFCYQTDVLALAQHVWSGGETHYDSLVGAILITVVSYIIHLGVSAMVKLPHRAFALSFAPSLILLGVLTSASIQLDNTVSVAFAAVVACILLVVVGVAMKLLNDYAPCESPLHGTSVVSQAAWYNYSLLAISIFVVFCMGNNDRYLHSVLRMEHRIEERCYDSVLEVSPNEGDASMTMLRAYALSKQNRLGERLFEYPLAGGARALVPGKDYDVRTLLIPDSLFWRNLGGYPNEKVSDVKHFLHVLQKQGMARPSVDDYMLTAYLLDRDLVGFAREIVKVYDFRTQQEKDEEMEIIEKKRKRLARLIGEQEAIDSIKPPSMISPSGVNMKKLDELPKHYCEALVLYLHLHSQRQISYSNTVVEADYDDFLKLFRTKHKTVEEHRNILKTAYFGTYWWYYYNKE